MGTEYELVLYTQEGVRLAVIDQAVDFEYLRVINGLGRFHVNLPVNFSGALIAKNRRIGFWRKPANGIRRQDFHGIVTRPARRQGTGDVVLRSIAGYAGNLLLKRRFVNYTAGSAQAEKSGPADNVMKAIVRENLGSSAPGARQLSSAIFSVASDAGKGPTVARAFAWKNVLETLQELSDAARQAGTEVYFDVVPASEAQVEFRTYIGQPGMDRRAGGPAPLILSVSYDNLRASEYDENFDDEANAIAAGGQGEGAARIRAVAVTAEASNNPFARAELFRDARHESNFDALLAIANAELIAQRGLRRFTAQVQSVPGAEYGLDWDFGDRVTATFDGERFDCLIRAVEVTVDGNGKEQINATLEAFV